MLCINERLEEIETQKREGQGEEDEVGVRESMCVRVRVRVC